LIMLLLLSTPCLAVNLASKNAPADHTPVERAVQKNMYKKMG